MFSKRVAVLAFALLVAVASAKKNLLPIYQGTGYIVWCTGECELNDGTYRPQGGVMLMGGGPDVDEAFEWFNRRTGGGDVVVLRASGTDDYNDYIYDIGGVNSVWTILTTSRTGAEASIVEDIIDGAEGIFVAGGDQYDYIDFWTGTYLEESVQYCIDSRDCVFGGTSAGLAIAGDFIYTAEYGSIISEEALVDPYDSWMTIGGYLFKLPYMSGIVTDSHFRDRDRMGRLITMMARLQEDGDVTRAYGLAVSEETALLIDTSGLATMVGYGEAYFLDSTSDLPTRCEPGTPLTYADIRIYKLDRTSSDFDLVSWTGSGGVQYYIDVISGYLSSSQGVGRNY